MNEVEDEDEVENEDEGVGGAKKIAGKPAIF